MPEDDLTQVAYVVAAADNVATAITDIGPGPVKLRGAAEGETEAAEAVHFGHKLALQDISAGAPIIKFGYIIGTASQPIAKGCLAHMHNIQSPLDQRSNEFEAQKEAECRDSYVLYRGEERIC